MDSETKQLVAAVKDILANDGWAGTYDSARLTDARDRAKWIIQAIETPNEKLQDGRTNRFDSESWGVVLNGPDSVLAAHSFEEAVEQCHRINSNIVRIKPEFDSEYHPLMWATIELWGDVSGGPHVPERTDWDNIC